MTERPVVSRLLTRCHVLVGDLISTNPSHCPNLHSLRSSLYALWEAQSASDLLWAHIFLLTFHTVVTGPSIIASQSYLNCCLALKPQGLSFGPLTGPSLGPPKVMGWNAPPIAGRPYWRTFTVLKVWPTFNVWMFSGCPMNALRLNHYTHSLPCLQTCGNCLSKMNSTVSLLQVPSSHQLSRPVLGRSLLPQGPLTDLAHLRAWGHKATHPYCPHRQYGTECLKNSLYSENLTDS